MIVAFPQPRIFPETNIFSIPKDESSSLKKLVIGDGHTMEFWHGNWIYGTWSSKPIWRMSDKPMLFVS
jgi:hypothetical protein